MTFTEKLQELRNTKSSRIWFMIGLIALVIILYITGVIKKWFAIWLGIVLLAAIGIETLNYDLDLGKLWETGNIQESRVSHTKDGLKLYGSCAIPRNQADASDLDCKNFSSQWEAQRKYNQCATEIVSYNEWVDMRKVKSLDVYGLDRDKDGAVCEALAWTAKEEVTEEVVVKESVSPTKKSTSSSTTKTTGTFQTTPVLRTSEPYTATPASDRSTPKALPAQ